MLCMRCGLVKCGDDGGMGVISGPAGGFYVVVVDVC